MSVRYDSIDPAVLMQAVSGDLASFQALSQTFLAIAPPMYERLRLALGAGDRSAVAHASHAFKGTAALVGAVALAARLQEIELAARGGGTLPGPRSAEPLAPLFAEVLREVAASITGYDGGAGLAPPAP